MDSWILKAIEREAEQRALERILTEKSTTLRVLGLSIDQILWLRHDYQRRTGLNASEIKP